MKKLLQVRIKNVNYPKVSIVTPSYNQGQFIEETILSVKNQNYPNIEHIIIDGGSNDNTLEILRKYEDVYNMRWVSEPDKGQADAINKGFKMSNGEIIGWLNSDDLYFDKDSVSVVVEKFEECEDVDILYGHTVLINAQNRLMRILLVPKFNYERLKRLNYIPQPSVFFRSSIVKQENLDISFHYSMDYEFWLRLGQKYVWKRVDRILSAERNHLKAKTMIESGRNIILEHNKLQSNTCCGTVFYILLFLDKLKYRLSRLVGLLILYKVLIKYNFAFPLRFDNPFLTIYHQLFNKNRNLI